MPAQARARVRAAKVNKPLAAPQQSVVTAAKEASTEMKFRTHTPNKQGAGVAFGTNHRGFWRSDALPIGIAVAMLLVVFYFALVSH